MCGQDGFGAQAELAVAVDGDGGVVDSGLPGGWRRFNRSTWAL
ncbi:MAG TPA: hypothetical protein VI011_02080 [Asanoa sp.]